MDSKKTKLLLEKYLEGETSLIEEKDLRHYFKSTEKIPNEWEGYRLFFGYYEQAKNESFPRVEVKHKSFFQPWMAAAAVIAIVISVQFYYATSNVLPSNQEAQLAFTQFKTNMEKVSSLLNKGAEKVAYLDYWNETTNKLIK